MISIVPLTEVDERVTSDLNALVAELRSDPGSPATKEHVEEIVNDKSAVILTARDGERIVGMAGLYIIPKVGKRSGLVEDVVVLAEYRGQGLGEKLMRALIDEARARNLGSLSLTSRPERAAAHKLYEKLGFKKRETDPFRLSL